MISFFNITGVSYKLPLHVFLVIKSISTQRNTKEALETKVHIKMTTNLWRPNFFLN